MTAGEVVYTAGPFEVRRWLGSHYGFGVYRGSVLEQLTHTQMVACVYARTYAKELIHEAAR